MSADGEQGGVLLPCPFCGGEAPTVWVYREKHSMFPQWVAHCKLCNITQKANTKAYAILAWNTRAAPATDTTEVDRYSEGREAGIRETLAEVADMMKLSGHLVHPIFIPAVEGLVHTLAKHPTSPEAAA